MFEVKKEKLDIIYNPKNKEEITDKIVQCWSAWDDVRHQQKADWDVLKSEFNLDFPKKYKDKADAWKSDIHLGKIYSLSVTLIAFIWDNVYSQVSRMFGVIGSTPEDEKNAPAQKAMIVSALEKMKVQSVLDEFIENLIQKGEGVLFVTWKRKTKTIKRPVSFWKKIFSGDFSSGQKYYTYEVTTYDNTTATSIDPLNIVYDPNLYKDWDNCPKIIKSFKSLEDLKNSKNYEITQKIIDELGKDIVSSEGKASEEALDDTKLGSGHEILEFYGDIQIGKEYYRNILATVLCRKYLIRFEQNPFVINPVIRDVLSTDPKSGRGIPLFKSIYYTCLAEEKMVNATIDNQSLANNPPHHAPADYYDKNLKEIKICPGKIIPYKNGSFTPGQLVPVALGQNNYTQTIYDLERIISETSGVFPNMQGQELQKDATATEIKVQAQGQTTRLSKILDNINSNVILALVELIGEFHAMIKDGDEELFVKDKGELTRIIINNEVRQGSYKYTYEDKNAVAQRKGMISEALAMINQAAQNPVLSQQIDWKECLSTGLEAIGFNNIEKFFLKEPQVNPTQNMNTGEPVPFNVNQEASPDIGGI